MTTKKKHRQVDRDNQPVFYTFVNKIGSGVSGTFDEKSSDIAADRKQSLAQMAIAWLLKDQRVTSVLIGASSTGQLNDNLKALENTYFSQQELDYIDNILL